MNVNRRIVLFVIATCMILSCKKAHLQHRHDHHHGSANEFMHRSSIEDLIDNFESPDRASYQEPDKVVASLGELEGKTIMDIGAGSGYFSFRLAAAGAKVIAADVNDEFQEYIRKKKDELGLDDSILELRKLPYDSPALGSAEADKVLVVNTYHHIEDRVEYFKKVKSGLKQGGELIIIDYFKKDIPVGPPRGHKISRDVVIDELAKAGFADIDTDIEMLKYQYVIRAKSF